MKLTVLASAENAEFPSSGDDLLTTGRRLNYAKWLTSGDHPLLARVMVNRLWMHHFGTGIVDTPGDFGYLGGRPSHPQLLDWLASELIANDWSLKHIQRLILTSATYRQSSTRHAHGNAIDRQKRLLWSMPVRRLETEIIRDSILATSGVLNQEARGPAVPVMADRSGQWVIGKENLNAGRPGAALDMKGQQNRRSVYIQVRRSRPLAVLEPFDLPTLSPNCNRRSSSTVAPQSLQMLNSQFVTEQSRLFADRLLQAGSTMEERIQRGWILAYGTTIGDEELATATRFVAEAETTLVEDYKIKGIKDDPQRDAMALFCHALISSNRFIYIE